MAPGYPTTRPRRQYLILGFRLFAPPRQLSLIVPPWPVRTSDCLGLRPLSDAMLTCVGGTDTCAHGEVLGAPRTDTRRWMGRRWNRRATAPVGPAGGPARPGIVWTPGATR
jgi:hypothetical protein